MYILHKLYSDTYTRKFVVAKVQFFLIFMDYHTP